MWSFGTWCLIKHLILNSLFGGAGGVEQELSGQNFQGVWLKNNHWCDFRCAKSEKSVVFSAVIYCSEAPALLNRLLRPYGQLF